MKSAPDSPLQTCIYLPPFPVPPWRPAITPFYSKTSANFCQLPRASQPPRVPRLPRGKRLRLPPGPRRAPSPHQPPHSRAPHSRARPSTDQPLPELLPGRHGQLVQLLHAPRCAGTRRGRPDPAPAGAAAPSRRAGLGSSCCRVSQRGGNLSVSSASAGLNRRGAEAALRPTRRRWQGAGPPPAAPPPAPAPSPVRRHAQVAAEPGAEVEPLETETRDLPNPLLPLDLSERPGEALARPRRKVSRQLGSPVLQRVGVR